MEFAEVARSLPQFGKSMRNLARSRAEVFRGCRGALSRSRDMCFGFNRDEACSCAGACGCKNAVGGCGCKSSSGDWDGSKLRKGHRFSSGMVHMEAIAHLHDEPIQSRMTMDAVGSDDSGDGPTAGDGFCLAAPYCRVKILCDHQIVVLGVVTPYYHCRFVLTMCNGSSATLELGSALGIPFGPPGTGVHLTLDGGRPQQLVRPGGVGRSPVELDQTEPCQSCEDVCGIVLCVLAKAASYPLAVTGNRLRKSGYDPLGPNSNTFVRYVAEMCGLAIKPRSLGLDTPGLEWSVEDVDDYAADRIQEYNEAVSAGEIEGQIIRVGGRGL